MKILILSHDEVLDLPSIKECIPVMRQALLALAAGNVHQPLRTIVRPPDAKGLMGLMPSYMSGDSIAFGLKAICISVEVLYVVRVSEEIDTGILAEHGPSQARVFDLKRAPQCHHILSAIIQRQLRQNCGLYSTLIRMVARSASS